MRNEIYLLLVGEGYVVRLKSGNVGGAGCGCGCVCVCVCVCVCEFFMKYPFKDPKCVCMYIII